MTRCLYVIALAVVVLQGCGAVTPSLRAWRPWTRTHQTQESVPLRSGFEISVVQEGTPLFGGSDLLNREVENLLADYLSRRGFQLRKSGAEYRLELAFGTRRYEKVESNSQNFSWSSTGVLVGTYSAAGQGAGLGVSIAKAIGASTQSTASKISNQTYQSAQYTHTLTMEISTAGGQKLWKGESTWDSPILDIRLQLPTAVQVLLSDLPSLEDQPIQVPAVKDTSAAAYYQSICNGEKFTCPATPYIIRFPDLAYGEYGVPANIRPNRILAALVDLIQTTEYSLPRGSKNFNDPTKEILWSKVQLGGTYLIGDDKVPTRILVDLAGSYRGYKIQKCWVATDGEWSDHKETLRKWKSRLEEYFDFYE